MFLVLTLNHLNNARNLCISVTLRIPTVDIKNFVPYVTNDETLRMRIQKSTKGNFLFICKRILDQYLMTETLQLILTL